MARRHIKVSIVLILFVVGILSTNALAINRESATIVPGQSVGIFLIGASAGTVIRSIDSTINPVIQKIKIDASTKIMYTYTEMGISLYFDSTSHKLERIDILTPALVVAESGIRVGSSVEAVKNFYGTPDSMQNGSLYSFPDRGIEFWINNKNLVTRIVVYASRKTD